MPLLELPERALDGPVVLRPLREDDVPAYAGAFRDDPRLGVLLGMESDPDEERLRRRLAEPPQQDPETRFVELVVADRGDDRFLGCVAMHSIDRHHGRGELAFFVVPGERRRGVCRAAVVLALDWAFCTLGFDRVEVTTTPDNVAVQALAAGLGFAREGLLRSRNLERGRRVDVVWFGLLRDEWRAGGAATRT